MRLREIAKIVGGELVGEDREVMGFSIDSRKIRKGECFIAIKGSRYDGHDFLEEVKRKGGAGALVSKKVDVSLPQVIVKDTVEALKYLAKYKRESFKGKVIGVTGSAGKTTTKELIHYVLSHFGRAEKTEGNMNSKIGLPLCILNMDTGADYWVLEHGASAIGDVKELVRITKPSIGVVTAIGEEHLETFGDIEGVIRGNLEISTFMGEEDTLIVPVNIKDRVKGDFRVITFGRGGDVEASDITVSFEGTRFLLMGKEAFVPVVNIGIVENVLASACVLKALGMKVTDIIPLLKDFKGVPGRMRIIKVKDYYVIDDSYNSNPLSLKNALNTLSLFPCRKVAILGDMLELGDFSEKLHREAGIFIADLDIDEIIFYGKWMKYAWEEAIKRHRYAKYTETKADILAEVDKMYKKDTVFLVKGSRGMAMEDIVNYLVREA